MNAPAVHQPVEVPPLLGAESRRRAARMTELAARAQAAERPA